MHIVKFTYRIRKKNERDWKTILGAAAELYKKYGDKSKRRISKKEDGEFLEITEKYEYGSRAEYEKVKRKVDADVKHAPLFKKMLKIIVNEKIEVETKSIKS